MKIFDKINDYINDNSFKINYYNNSLNVKNYLKIIDFNNQKIIIKHELGKIIIDGNNLIINKMFENEILITGNINSIIFNNE